MKMMTAATVAPKMMPAMAELARGVREAETGIEFGSDKPDEVALAVADEREEVGVSVVRAVEFPIVVAEDADGVMLVDVVDVSVETICPTKHKTKWLS